MESARNPYNTALLAYIESERETPIAAVVVMPKADGIAMETLYSSGLREMVLITRKSTREIQPAPSIACN